MNNLTFEELPKAVANIQLKLDEICSLLENKQNSPKQSQDELLTVPDAATFLSISVPTIYGLISKGELPVMKRSKRCYFSKLELINYLKEGRKKTEDRRQKTEDRS